MSQKSDEVGGDVYAPLHDFQGNITGLVNKGHVITNAYDAFGREDNDSFISPWRFASKRYEEGLIYFGQRFYDPSHGRWLTPDPLGCVESLNVYWYVLNSPLNRLDLFGLASIDFHPSDITKEFRVPYLYQPVHTVICPAILTNTPFVIQSTCVVSSGHWHHIQYSPFELVFDRANLFEHFHEIVSKQPDIIGVKTMQNGICTTLSEFVIHCESSMACTPEGTTLVGLYNPTLGSLSSDLGRCKKELVDGVMVLRFLTEDVGKHLDQVLEAILRVVARATWT